MRIEFCYCPWNTEVKLIEDLDGNASVVDKFYTSAKQVVVTSLPFQKEGPWDSIATFQIAQKLLPKAAIGGKWGHLDPYWQEREEREN